MSWHAGEDDSRNHTKKSPPILSSWIANVQPRSGFTKHRSPEGHHTYLACESDQSSRLLESSPLRAEAGRCNETSAPANKLPSSGAPEARRALPPAASADSPAAAPVVRYQNTHR